MRYIKLYFSWLFLKFVRHNNTVELELFPNYSHKTNNSCSRSKWKSHHLVIFTISTHRANKMENDDSQPICWKQTKITKHLEIHILTYCAIRSKNEHAKWEWRHHHALKNKRKFLRCYSIESLPSNDFIMEYAICTSLIK